VEIYKIVEDALRFLTETPDRVGFLLAHAPALQFSLDAGVALTATVQPYCRPSGELGSIVGNIPPASLLCGACRDSPWLAAVSQHPQGLRGTRARRRTTSTCICGLFGYPRIHNPQVVSRALREKLS